ncbi:hypothetical protein GPROT1_01801 [Gammaproteobacteria bacterium]|nr:hypothetical protein GPROT1_01801 [Gammaproteobacteria bacterium]
MTQQTWPLTLHSQHGHFGTSQMKLDDMVQERQLAQAELA